MWGPPISLKVVYLGLQFFQWHLKNYLFYYCWLVQFKTELTNDDKKRMEGVDFRFILLIT
jgi:hypothetical protein